MLFTHLFTVSALTALAYSQTTLSPAQETKVVNDLESYLTSLTAQPGYTAAVAALQSAIPSSVLDEIENDPDAYLQSVFTATATPAWFTALPTSAQSYFSSVGAAEISIVSKDAKGPAPTAGVNVKVAGMAMAAGGAALALL